MNPPYAKPAEGAGRPARVTVPALAAMAREGTPIAMLTAYDASFAALCDRAGVDVVLVGDSLGMVIQGRESTLPVTLADFGSYQAGPEIAYTTAAAAMQAGAQMVKLEGGAWLAPTVSFLVARGVPVCGHVGLLPQAVHALGGYRVQGKTPDDAAALEADARALVESGAGMLVVECVPSAVGAAVTRAAGVPVIGIGAGPSCSGQVLVIYDALGIQPGRPARFVRNFMTGHDSIEAALAAYVAAVRSGAFPAPEHCF